MIRKGLSYPIPTPEEDTWGEPNEESPIGFEDVLEPEIDVDDDMV